MSEYFYTEKLLVTKINLYNSLLSIEQVKSFQLTGDLHVKNLYDIFYLLENPHFLKGVSK